MINQRPNGAGRVFTEQIIQWKELEYILTPHPPASFILWLLTDTVDTWELGVRWGPFHRWKNTLETSCYQFCARHSAECFGHGSHAQLPSHCIL